MFGHQQDITAQDRKTDVTVNLPDDAIAALTASHAQDDRDDPLPDPTQVKHAADAHHHVRQSIDGFSAPTSARASIVDRTPSIPVEPLPSSYLEFLGAPQGAQPEAVTPPQPKLSTVQVVTDEPADTPFAAGFGTDEQAGEQEHETTANNIPADITAIKQAALAELSPLVHQLDQTPEEHFKTLLMLIQASDDTSLLADAYNAARAITDEKLRAEALLQVVNEINFFTRQRNNP